MKTYNTKLSDIKREQHVIDAKDEVLGRLATRISGVSAATRPAKVPPSRISGWWTRAEN
jgi:ribosomal protein L13